MSDEPTDLSTDTRYVWDDDVFHGPWCRADAHQPNCIHIAYLRPGDAPEFNEPLGEAATHAELAASFRGRSTLRSDLAAAQAQVARLRAVITAALDDLEARDELSALDGLRAALAPGGPPAEPSTEE